MEVREETEGLQEGAETTQTQRGNTGETGSRKPRIQTGKPLRCPLGFLGLASGRPREVSGGKRQMPETLTWHGGSGWANSGEAEEEGPG